MIFAILFVVAFLIGLVSYLLTNRWWYGVAIVCVLFVANVLSDTSASEYWFFTLIFGVPIVFVAALLGAYVVERGRTNDDEDQPPAGSE